MSKKKIDIVSIAFSIFLLVAVLFVVGTKMLFQSRVVRGETDSLLSPENIKFSLVVLAITAPIIVLILVYRFVYYSDKSEEKESNRESRK